MKMQQSRPLALDSNTLEEIQHKRQLIQRIKANNAQKLEQAVRQASQNQQQEHSHPHTSTSTVVDPQLCVVAPNNSKPPETDKNPNVSDTDKMIFDKKFKNYLNHRQEYLERARGGHQRKQKATKKAPIDVGDAQYYNEEEVLSNTGSEYQYQNASDMQAAYEQMTTGKKQKGGKFQLFPPQLFENQLRAFEFEALLAEGDQDEQKAQSINKDRLLNYLFDEPIIMMLYSINPYQLGDELAEFQTKTNDLLNYQEFSAFLLADREPTYFEYTNQNLIQARKLGRGIKCAPIIAKWIDSTGIFQFLLQTFKSIDVRGDSQVDRTFLAKKLRKEAETRRISEAEVVQVVNINKKLPLNRLLYQIEYEVRGQSQNWSEEQFVSFLENYKRRATPQKDRLITKLILTGKYDSSYVYVVSQEVLEIVKDIFKNTPKFAEYFVLKDKFLQNVCNDPRYKKIQSMWVRSEANRYVKRETVQDTLVRIYAEGDQYLDIEEVLDFLTNRGRPKVVEYQVYLQNLQRQIAIIEEEERIRRQKHGDNADTASSDEEFNNQIRQKQKKRKQDKLKEIRNSNNFQAGKKFNVTIPIPFDFDIRDKKKKLSIRERKLKQMLDEKEKKLQEEMKPIPPKEVPQYVKENLYDRMLKQQERERKERLERFRLQIMSQVRVSDRLMRPKSKELHCDFSGPEYKFQARQMPWYCEVKLIKRINAKKQERRERILQEIIKRHTDYELPDGVQRMIKRQEEREEKKQARARTASTGTFGQCTFMPKISYGVPDFKTIHQQLHFDIQNAKNFKEPIKVEPFSFENRPHKAKTTYQQRKQPRPERIRHSKYERGQNQQDFQNIPKTEKFEALVELRRRQQQQKFLQKQKQKRMQAVRKLRESKFAPVVWKALKKNTAVDPQRSRAFIADRIKQFKRDQKKKKEAYQNQMIQILTKVYQRPLLLESKVQQQDRAGMRGPGDSNYSKSKPKNQEFHNQDEYLEGGYYGNQANLKLDLGKRKPAPHMQDEARRAAVEGHQLGQYPPEGYEYEDEDDQEGFHQSQLYAEDYEQGNLHTS